MGKTTNYTIIFGERVPLRTERTRKADEFQYGHAGFEFYLDKKTGEFYGVIKDHDHVYEQGYVQ